MRKRERMSEARTRSEGGTAAISAGRIRAPCQSRAPIGRITTIPSIAIVMPKETPKPGRAEAWRKAGARMAYFAV